MYLNKEKSYNGFIIEEDYRKSGKCRMAMAKTEFYKVYQGFILPKQSLLKPIIDQKYKIILRLEFLYSFKHLLKRL